MASENRRTIRTVERQRPEVYEAGLVFQQSLFDENLRKKASEEPTENTLVFCEHTPVYTLGKNGDEKNLLFKPELTGADFYRIERGGDITFHGPGQLVIYPIFDLDTLDIGVSEFVGKLEETVILTLKEYGLTGERLEGASGVWLDITFNPRKICAIGLKISRKCSMHGISINLNTDLRYFSYIVPCGLQDKGVTSLQKELGKEISMKEFQTKFCVNFEKIFNVDLILE